MSRSDSELDTELAGVLQAALRGLPLPAVPLDPAVLAARLAEPERTHHDD